MTTTDDNPLTLNLDPKMRDRLKLAAFRKGLPVDQYCLELIRSELAKNEEDESVQTAGDKLTIPELIALQRIEFGDRRFDDNSVDLIREAREIRNAQMDEW